MSRLLKDVAPFGFVNMPLIYWELARCGSSCQSEAITHKPEWHYWCILMAHISSMVFNIPTHHLEVNVLLSLVKHVADTKAIKMLNNVKDKWQSCKSRSLASWAPLTQKSHSNNTDFDSAEPKVLEI